MSTVTKWFYQYQPEFKTAANNAGYNLTGYMITQHATRDDYFETWSAEREGAATMLTIKVQKRNGFISLWEIVNPNKPMPAAKYLLFGEAITRLYIEDETGFNNVLNAIKNGETYAIHEFKDVVSLLNSFSGFTSYATITESEYNQIKQVTNH